MKRKIILLFTLLNAFSFTSFASTQTTIIESENVQEETINDTNIQETTTSDTNIQETIISEEQQETSISETLETVNETESEYPLVTLNFDVEFTFDTETEPVYLIQVSIPNGLSGGDGEEYYEIINLSSQSNFTDTYEMNCYYNAIQLNASVDGDNAYLYNISFEGLPQAPFFGDIVRNSGYIENPQNGDVYNLHLIVSQNKDAKIKSPNQGGRFYESKESDENIYLYFGGRSGCVSHGV